MALQSQVSNIEIVSVDGFFGNQHMLCVETVVGTDLDGTHFLFSSLDTDYYAWYNTGASTDPAVAGRTGVEIEVLTTDTAPQVAVKSAAALALEAQLNAASLTNQNIFLLEVKGLGEPVNAAADVDTTFNITVQRAGSKLELGFLEGDVELTLEEQLFEIVTHQTGSQVIGGLRTGTTLGPISMTLKETTAAKLKELLEASAAVEHEGEATRKVTGIGSLAGSKQFGNVFTDAKMLVLHPTKNADTNYDEDFAFWLAYPNLNALTFSGEADRKLTIDFNIYLDELRDNQVNQMVVGLNAGGNWQDNFLKG